MFAAKELVLRIAAFTYTAFVDRHWFVALGIITDVVHAFAGAIAVGSIAVGRNIAHVRGLYLRAFPFRVGRWVNGRFFVLKVGVFLSVSHGVRRLE